MIDRTILRAAIGPCVAAAVAAAALAGALLLLDLPQLTAVGALPYLIMLACPLVHLLVMRRHGGHCAAPPRGDAPAADAAPPRTPA